ncbi:hypothetical protein CCUS01_16622 [Colletotrichum cuscutae]|uniref:Uncharacterized protein n=1 Tax=Colletotrichum cuscutae TaxID=1209917 RepID=A0AAI9VCL9_9PEZI|nr:hypothetical protein CCUS01_16622 [Colletotrichum cuscutae]
MFRTATPRYGYCRHRHHQRKFFRHHLPYLTAPQAALPTLPPRSHHLTTYPHPHRTLPSSKAPEVWHPVCLVPEPRPGPGPGPTQYIFYTLCVLSPARTACLLSEGGCFRMIPLSPLQLSPPLSRTIPYQYLIPSSTVRCLTPVEANSPGEVAKVASRSSIMERLPFYLHLAYNRPCLLHTARWTKT